MPTAALRNGLIAGLEGRGMPLSGSIIDSWVEPAGRFESDSRLVLQVAPRGESKEMVIVEVDASMVPDRDWLIDLGENLCHGSPVSAELRPTRAGLYRAVRIELAR